MAFSFANASGNSAFGSSVMASSNAETQTGPDLEEIQTEVSSASWIALFPFSHNINLGTWFSLSSRGG